MAPPIKAVLFDIGGVCVVSPFQAILDYETQTLRISPGWINFSISRTAPNGAWQRLERGEAPFDCANAAFFAAWKRDLTNPRLWDEFCSRQKQMRDEGVTPALPDIDAEWLYWRMMEISREPDRYMFPALKRLKASGKFVIGALSNTSIYPEGHAYNQPVSADKDVKGQFDVFVSSAHVGLRKPHPEIYELALKMMNERIQEGGTALDKSEVLRAENVLFLDDIGENLKQGKKTGFRTIKVWLGKTRDAVKELEAATGMRLLEEGGAKL